MEINATRGRLGDKFLFYDQIALFPINSPKFIQNQYKQINKSSNIYFDVNCPSKLLIRLPQYKIVYDCAKTLITIQYYTLIYFRF